MTRERPSWKRKIRRRLKGRLQRNWFIKTEWTGKRLEDKRDDNEPDDKNEGGTDDNNEGDEENGKQDPMEINWENEVQKKEGKL